MTDSSVLRPDLALVLERITDGFFALDPQWNIIYMNAEARRILRATEDPVGHYWLDMFPLARGRLFEREYRRAMQDQIVVQFVEYSKTAAAWLEVKAYPSTDGLSVYFRDVSSRIEAQREIELNAARQQAIINFGRSALVSTTYDRVVGEAIDLLREILETNVVEVFDYKGETRQFSILRSVGWSPGAAFDPAEPLLEHLFQVARTGEAFVCSDVRIEPRYRSLRCLEKCKVLSGIVVLIGSAAAPIGVIAAYYALPRTFSVGDVRFAEAIAQTIAESFAAFDTSHRMAQILESIRDAFVAVDRDLRITMVNSPMAMFWKHSEREMIGAPLSKFMLQSQGGDVVMEHFTAALREQRSLSFENQDRGRWFETRLFPFATGVAAYIRDITPQKTEQQRVLELNAELERRVDDRTRQLEAANKELESFSYSVSHDLRAPLRAIDGFSQALSEDYADKLDDSARGYLDRVRKAAQRMADLIDALLRLAKVARAPIRFVDVDLSEAARLVGGELQENDPERSVEIVVEPGLSAVGEPNLLLNVFQNLMGNAWKFTRETRDARIEVGRNASGEVFVRDNGAGFDMAYANKLFGAFQRLHSTDEYEGTGIGLATVARILHRHGGSIRAEGEVGKGATFSMTFPVNQVQSAHE